MPPSPLSLLLALSACAAAAAFPVSSSANGSVLVGSAFDGNLTLSAGAGLVVSDSLFAANGGVLLNATHPAGRGLLCQPE